MKKSLFRRNWMFDEINIFGIRLDVYTGRNGTLPGFEISKPQKDNFLCQEWNVLSVALWPFDWKVIKRGHYYTHTGQGE